MLATASVDCTLPRVPLSVRAFLVVQAFLQRSLDATQAELVEGGLHRSGGLDDRSPVSAAQPMRQMWTLIPQQGWP